MSDQWQHISPYPTDAHIWYLRVPLWTRLKCWLFRVHTPVLWESLLHPGMFSLHCIVCHMSMPLIKRFND